jgi:hypothetical protein
VEAYTLENFGAYITDHSIGASFRDAFDRNTAPWSQHVEVKAGDAIQLGWDGEPIEVLFLDIVKSWRMNDFVLNTFFPCLIPGRSILVQQDYLWSSGPWLHITMELMKASVEILDAMPNGSVAYLLTSNVPDNLVGVNLRRSLTPTRQFMLLDDAINRWDGENRGLLELVKVRLLAEHDLQAAKRAFELVRAKYPHEPRVQQCINVIASKLVDDGRDWLTNLD